MRTMALISAALVLAPTVSLAAPSFTERSFNNETIEGTTVRGLEFTVANSSENPSGELFSWVIFKDRNRQSESTNGWGYQTVGNATEWQAPILSDGGVIDPTPSPQPLSWSELFSPINQEAQNLLDDGMQAHGFFLPMYSGVGEFGFVGPDGNNIALQTADPDDLIFAGEAKQGFFALGDDTPGSPAAFAQLQSSFGQTPQITTSQFTSVPVPASISLLAMGLIGLALFGREGRSA